MLGRTYSTGFEADLDYWLLTPPPGTVLNPAWPWASGIRCAAPAASRGSTPRSRAHHPRARRLGRAYGDAISPTTSGSPATASTPTTTTS